MEKVKLRHVVPMDWERRMTDVSLVPRDQDSWKTDRGWLTLEDINKQEHTRRSRPC